MNLQTVREEFSKWLMRFQQGSRPLKILMWGIITVNTFVTAWASFLPTWLTALSVFLMIIGFAGFIWAYDRFQVLNIQNRWNQDRTNNFIGPGFTMQYLLQARQLGALSKGMKEEKTTAEIDKDLEQVTREFIENYRDGINMREFE